MFSNCQTMTVARVLKFPTHLVLRWQVGSVLRRLATIRSKYNPRPFIQWVEVYGGETMVQGYFVCHDQLVFQDVVDLVLSQWPDIDGDLAWRQIKTHKQNQK